jgi:ABC-2 type transport system ATP-binding protein
VDAVTSGGAAIEVRGLRKAYGAKQAVAGVDLTVDRGEVFALLGPNGAGKTTTVEVLEGYRRRDAGEVTVLGADPAHPGPAWRARVGIVLQGTGEFDELTVGEVVRLFAGYYPSPDIPATVIDRVGLTDKRDAADPHAVRRPEAPPRCGAGHRGPARGAVPRRADDRLRSGGAREFWELIRALADGGTTILLTTHYLQEAEELAHRVGVIADGRLIAVATPADLGGRSHSAAVVSWLGPAGPRSERTETPTAYVSKLSLDFEGAEIPGLDDHPARRWRTSTSR